MTLHVRRLAASLSLLALLAMALAVPAHATDLKAMALMTPEQPADFGWNQQGIEGAAAAAKAHGITFIPAAGVGYGDMRATLRELVDQGAGLIISHGPFTASAEDVARETHVNIAVAEDHAIPPYIAGYSLGGQDGAYLAGVLAALMTKTGVLGIVVSSESPEWDAQSAGFAQGARAAKPGIPIRYAVIGVDAYSDAAGAKRVTEAMLATGPDIIFGQGDGATFGMIQAIETATPAPGVTDWFIDVIGDKTSLDKGHLLSSVLWNFEPVFSRMIGDVQDGSFGKHGYELSLSDGSIGLLHSKHIPNDVWAQVMAARDGIAAGRIHVDKIFDAQKVKALVAGP